MLELTLELVQQEQFHTTKISKRESLLFLILHYFKYRRDEYARAKKIYSSNIHPFNNLNTFELDDLVEDLDIVYFKAKLNSSTR